MTGSAGLRDRAVERFRRYFGASPCWVAAAPGRVNLIGEHTDYNAGLVLPMAIDRWCLAVARPASESRSRIRAHDLKETAQLSLSELLERGPEPRSGMPGWASYVAGAIIEHAGALGVSQLPELDLLITSTVPSGGGLSSSAALETAGAIVLEAAVGRKADPIDRALSCQRAEHLWAGVPCGLMDQIASSCGVEDHALLIDCRDSSVSPTPLPTESEAVILVVNSGVHHELASGEYARRRAACERAAAKLGVSSLRELEGGGGTRSALLDDEESRCVRHVVTEIERVHAAAAALGAGDLERFGRLMLESHTSLRDDYRVSCRELDEIVELAMGVDGVLGVRMTGGGFGGCAVVLCRGEAESELAGQLPQRYLESTGARCSVERVRAVSGASVQVISD